MDLQQKALEIHSRLLIIMASQRATAVSSNDELPNHLIPEYNDVNRTGL
jgi:hypothetical protein